MKICTNCNRVLSDDEPRCPYCSSDQLVDGSFADAYIDPDTDALMSEVLYSTSIIELPEDLKETALEAIDTELSDNYDFPPESEPTPEPFSSPDFSSLPDSAPANESPAQLNSSKPELQGELELRVKDIVKAEGAQDESAAPGKLGITLIALLVTAVLIFAVMCLVKYMKAPAATDSSIMLNYISGEWMSEPFVFADDLSHGYVELLQIRPDGTFTLTHLIPDVRNENGWKDGSWQVDLQLSGTVELFVENKCIVFQYTEFGKKYYLDRFIVRMEDDVLALREFYDDDMKLSYDIVYKRVAPASQTAEKPSEKTSETLPAVRPA
ncbi:MAG: hypothetical protein RR998_04445 [Oscillospiraceae bacterium]